MMSRRFQIHGVVAALVVSGTDGNFDAILPLQPLSQRDAVLQLLRRVSDM